MDFIELVGGKVVNIGKEVADKAKEAAEIANLKNQIRTCDEVIRKNYMEIGRKYYDNFAESAEDLFSKQCKAIRNAENGKEALKEKLNEMSGESHGE